jgi:cardiolipin synthase (CMP-forming)
MPGSNKIALTIPNLLTLLRFLLIPVFVLASLRGAYNLAFCAFVGAAITDAFDGYIARRLNQQSRIGAFLDPAADKLMMIAGYIVFTIRGTAPHTLPMWLTFTVFMRDLVIVLFVYLLYSRVRVTKFPPSIPGKLSTICQAVALAVTIAANTFFRPLALFFLEASWVVSFVVTLYSGFDYLKKWNAVVLEQQP